MLWSFVIWIGIAVGVLSLGFTYLNMRLVRTMGLSPTRKKAARAGLAAMFLVPVLSMFLFRFMEGWGGAWAWIVYVGLGLLSLLFTAVVARDLLLLGLKGYERLASLLSSRRRAQPDPSRRAFLLQTSNLAVLGLAGILTTYGVYEARRRPGIVELVIPIQRLPEAFNGFRIIQITDIHAGLTVKRGWIETIAQQVQDLKPDLVALTGDLVDGSVRHLRNEVAPLGELVAPAGKFFVTGNHEYYSGAEPWVNEAERMGYNVLLNAHQLIVRNGSAIVLAGVTDSSGGNFLSHHASDPAKAVAGAPADAVKILLAHQPRSLYSALPLGFDLQLSGHTHGGQFFPWNLLATIGQPYIAGLHKRENTWIYVSRGTGYWGPPVRLAARSEITVITLTNKT
ncbi:metallophosphoesterase [bacterium]|nr:MAG: metallophosphoesterase [bacterium]